jgi:multiple sugar transport system permease protein
MTTDTIKSDRRLRRSDVSLSRPVFGRARVLRSLIKHALLILVCFVMLYPVLWLVVSSIRPQDQIFTSTGLVVTDPDFSNYSTGWNALGTPFGAYMINSIIVTVGAILGNLISCSMAAYAFARMRFRGRKLFFGIMLVTIMLPIQVIIIPQYILFSQFHWVNTFLPLIVPKFLATDSFFIFLMVQFIRGIPRELDEAARIDGAGPFRVFRSIILPLMVPALATTTIFTFIWTWSDFFSQLIYLTSPANYTVSIALRNYIDAQATSSWGGMFAMSVVSLLPVFIVFLFGQRYLLNGIATTGGK